METKILTLDYLHSILKPRPAEGHKGTFGHALVIAGKFGMAGAAVLAARACLRSGVGKVTAHIPRGIYEIIQTSVPEAIVHLDADVDCFRSPVTCEGYDAVAVGPGLGTSEAAADALSAQLEGLGNRPCVIDADGLNMLAHRPSLLKRLPRMAVLTPHAAEYRRLAGDTPLKNFAEQCGAIIVAKGHRTKIASPDGTVYECPWGNNGMATAGSGDVLTGIIVALMAQGYAPMEAANLGVSLHALAGDAAAEQLGVHSLIASDIVDYIPKAFRVIGV